MTAVKANHQASLIMSSGAIGPWSELMTYAPGQMAENAHYCWVWSHLLLEMWDVHTFSFQLLAQNFDFSCYGHEVLLS